MKFYCIPTPESKPPPLTPLFWHTTTGIVGLVSRTVNPIFSEKYSKQTRLTCEWWPGYWGALLHWRASSVCREDSRATHPRSGPKATSTNTKVKGQLHSTMSCLQELSWRFTLYSLFNWTPGWLCWEVFSHIVINAWWLFVHKCHHWTQPGTRSYSWVNRSNTKWSKLKVWHSSTGSNLGCRSQTALTTVSPLPQTTHSQASINNIYNIWWWILNCSVYWFPDKYKLQI